MTNEKLFICYHLICWILRSFLKLDTLFSFRFTYYRLVNSSNWWTVFHLKAKNCKVFEFERNIRFFSSINDLNLNDIVENRAIEILSLDKKFRVTKENEIPRKPSESLIQYWTLKERWNAFFRGCFFPNCFLRVFWNSSWRQKFNVPFSSL